MRIKSVIALAIMMAVVANGMAQDKNPGKEPFKSNLPIVILEVDGQINAQDKIPAHMKDTEADNMKSNGDSYFFTRVFSIWGWASWARVVNHWDGNYGFVNDPQQFELLKQKVEQYHQRRDMIQMCQDHAASGKEFYESIF